ncbi:MAG TPA: TetR/AcrR family transcriptional regulator [Terracidiphilus sp.]|nr:TetR/AcrR family transcriptional regulator [Terracidiphilus sp.]
MPSGQKQSVPRRPRADALRNRALILEVAKDAFTRSGAATSMDEIAKKAGVGPGTLYRHFPTRDALLEAVYRTEVEKLAAAQHRFSKTMPPVEALRAWMKLFVDYVEAKHIIAPALNTLVGGASRIYAATGDLVKDAINTLVENAIASGDIRPGIDPLDLLRALVGLSQGVSGPGWTGSAKRLVDILILGSRPVDTPSRKPRRK